MSVIDKYIKWTRTNINEEEIFQVMLDSIDEDGNVSLKGVFKLRRTLSKCFKYGYYLGKKAKKRKRR